MGHVPGGMGLRRLFVCASAVQAAALDMNSNSHQRRTVVTGMGVIAPNGCDLDTFWSTIVHGISAAARVTRFDTSAVPNKVAAEVKDFDCSRYVDGKKMR